MNAQPYPTVERQLQLQLFDAKARAYVTVETLQVRERMFDSDYARMRADGKPWRIVKPDRPLKPKYYMSGGGAYGGADRYSRTRHDVIGEYLVWAADNGVKQITAFSGTLPKHIGRGDIAVRVVDPETYFNVEETIDGDGFTAIIDDHMACYTEHTECTP